MYQLVTVIVWLFVHQFRQEGLKETLYTVQHGCSVLPSIV